MPVFTLTPAQLALLPTDEDVAAYEKDGYYVSQEGVLPDALIDEAWEGSHRFYEGERDFSILPSDTGYSNWRKGDSDGLRNNEFVSLQKKELLALATYPMLGAIAAKLTRSAIIRVLDDQLFYKPSKTQTTATTVSGWHSDQAYWPTCSSTKMTTAWIPLHTVEPERSPLVIMAGSHRWEGVPRMSFNNKNLAELEEQLREQGKDVRLATMTLKKGQASFHQGWTIHGSYANTSGLPRLSYAVHMQDGDNHYRPHVNAHGKEVHMYDETLCRKLPNGDPDFSDPAIFPTIWSEGK